MLELKDCEFERVVVMDHMFFINGKSFVNIIDSTFKDFIGVNKVSLLSTTEN